MMAQLPILPAPEVNPETEFFWSQAAERKFFIKTCHACGQAHWYPRASCPFCASADTAWLEASGRGKIYSFSLVSPQKAPYVIAFVTLDEGPTVLTNILAATVESIKIGQSLRVAFAPSDQSWLIPVFVPVANV